MKRTTGFPTICAIAALSSNAAFGAVTLLDDTFGDGAIGTNPGTGGGFFSLDNGVNTGTGSVTESGTLVQIVDGTGSNTTGILSTNDFGLSNSALTYTATWTVANWASPGTSGTATRRAIFSLQTNNDFIFAGGAEESRIALVIDERANNALLQYQNRSSSTNANFSTNTFALDSTFAGDTDGFTVTLTLDLNGYSFTTTGLSTTNQINLTGTWATLGTGTNFATVLGTDGDMHIGAYVQNSDGTNNSTLNIDRIQLTSIPEPTGAALLAMSGLCVFVRRRR